MSENQEVKGRTQAEIDQEYTKLAMTMGDCIFKGMLCFEHMKKLSQEVAVPAPAIVPEVVG